MTDTDDDNWGWVRGATNYRSAAVLIRNLIDCASKGGNFVLNVGPMANGDFPPEHVVLITAIGGWLDMNGAAIYGTSPAPEVETPVNPDFVYYATKRDNRIYLHVIKWPTGTQTVRIHRPNFSRASLLDSRLGRLACENSERDGITKLQIKSPQTMDPYATVVRLDFGPQK